MAAAIAIGQNAGTLIKDSSEDLTDGFVDMILPPIAELGRSQASNPGAPSLAFVCAF
jgi:hypothetical protein